MSFMSVSQWIEPALNISIKHEHICHAPSCTAQPMMVFCIHVIYQTQGLFDPCQSCGNLAQEVSKFYKLTAPVGFVLLFLTRSGEMQVSHTIPFVID